MIPPRIKKNRTIPAEIPPTAAPERPVEPLVSVEVIVAVWVAVVVTNVVVTAPPCGLAKQ
jgi:hypothetical protein